MDERSSESDNGVAPSVLILGGSARENSFTWALLSEFEASLTRLGATTVVWDPRDRPLPTADPAFHANPIEHPSELVRQFVGAADACDAFVLGSPVYHNSFSGLLKNALDLLAIKQFEHKPVGLASHGGRWSTQALDQLRVVVRGLSAVATPTQVSSAAPDYEVAGGLPRVVSEELRLRVDRASLELIVYAVQMARVRGALSQ